MKANSERLEGIDSISIVEALGALKKGRWEVYYDGECAFCRRWVGRLRKLADRRVAFLDFREHGGNVAHLNPDFGRAAYLIIDRRIALPGFDGFRTLCLAAPTLWILLPVLHLPGAGAAGKWVYSCVSQKYGPVK